mgnify:CR=1 FL=1
MYRFPTFWVTSFLKLEENYEGEVAKRYVLEDYLTEFHDYKIAIKVVDSLDQAIVHINTYSSGHTESILTKDHRVGERFANSIDSSVVFINASTRFTDGDVFGLGAEIGISTQKLHARGPMGLEALTSERYIVKGDGQIRE